MIRHHQADIQDVEAPVTIEVTPEMVSAGVSALQDARDSSLAFQAISAFQAMAEARASCRLE